MVWIVILYFAFGLMLTFMWWKDEYEPEYEYYKSDGDTDNGMASILLLLLLFFWPIKLIKNAVAK